MTLQLLGWGNGSVRETGKRLRLLFGGHFVTKIDTPLLQTSITTNKGANEHKQ